MRYMDRSKCGDYLAYMYTYAYRHSLLRPCVAVRAAQQKRGTISATKATRFNSQYKRQASRLPSMRRAYLVFYAAGAEVSWMVAGLEICTAGL